MEEVEVRERIVSAYMMFLKNDSYLLEVNANERSMTHKLAEYLQIVFPEYHLDCEYNRNGIEPKRISQFKKQIQSDNDEGVTVFPDIIIHHRGTADNFIVIEAKKTSNIANDEQKLLTYKSDLQYQFAAFIQFPVENRLEEFSENDFDDYIRFI
jgi:hypothetical protein